MITALISGLAVGCVYALVAIGFSMIFRAMALVNFAQGDIMMLGAFAGYTLLLLVPGAPYPLLVLGAIATGAVIGYLLERLILRPAVKRNANQIYLVLLTLGIGMVLSNGARLIWGANPVVYDLPLRFEIVEFGDETLPVVYFYIAGGMAVILMLLHYFFTKTWTGLTLRAVADDPNAAGLMGISVTRASSIAFIVAAMLGTVAGVFYAPLYFVSFDMGLIGIKAFAAAAVGGFGNVQGAVIGGLVIGVAEAIGGSFLGTEFQDSIAFATMIILLLIRPKGLLGKGVLAP
ncbi:ABC transporter permease subunit [Parapusillimonas granuli]|uniref:Branched-chain amino acid ABC transporter permease n=1 Tax=Parapusillimonas granuli TaxID=380911 RepID=A0A853G0A9_9BURK|nr:branched-chain amino acid transport system permease protein [Parapusillimonas granuli]MEB2401025.1 branched-chain amino acid ABC transporter permease [Alcaligenaceae bacterium]NYT49729.1 branched-chain amino acid ABC transporter permease [Parapusillimonas granuli]